MAQDVEHTRSLMEPVDFQPQVPATAAPQDKTSEDNRDLGTAPAQSDVVTERRPIQQPAATVEPEPAVTRADLANTFGGMFWGSSFIGFAVAMFFTVVFLGIVGAIAGAVGYQLGSSVPRTAGHITGLQEQLGGGALIGSLIAVVLAYVIGGYTAGRMARFDGLLNGVGVWFWTIIAAVVLGAVGAGLGSTRFNVANQLHLTVNGTDLTMAGAISIGVTLIVMLVGAILGGVMGERFHRRIDRAAGL